MPRRGENIYHRKDGRWEGRYQTGYENGKTKYRSIYGRSYAEVKEKLARLRFAPTPKKSCRMTVKALFTEWLAAIKNSVKPSTFANYVMKIETHLLPKFGAVPYEKLCVQDVQAFIVRKLASGLSAKYVLDIVTVFKSMTKYMSRVHGYQNPLVNVILPKAERKETPLFSESQQKELTTYLLSNLNTAAIGILLSLFCGLRIGEVCGLRWSDFDLQNGMLSVRRTVQRISQNHKSELLVGSPKSRSSKRDIPIPSFLIVILRQYVSAENIYVLTDTDNPLDPRTLQNRFHAILKKAGLPSCNYHSLRHLFATNCIAAGFDVKTLSEILGHSSVEITLNRYVHSSVMRKKACMELLQIKADLPSELSSEGKENAA